VYGDGVNEMVERTTEVVKAISDHKCPSPDRRLLTNEMDDYAVTGAVCVYYLTGLERVAFEPRRDFIL
jgi:hypothetical protein